MNDEGEDWTNCFENFFHHELSRNSGEASHGHRLVICQKSGLEARPENDETGVSSGLAGYAGATSPTHPSCHSTTTSCSVSYHTDCSIAANRMHLISCQVSDTTKVYQSSKEEDDEEDYDDDKGMSRSEKKRSREKQRRSDFNQQFSELKDVLGKIDEAEESRTAQKRQRRTLKSTSAKNRQDLIAHAVDVLVNLHNKNQEQMKEIQELKAEVEKLKQISAQKDSDVPAEATEKTPEEKREQVRDQNRSSFICRWTCFVFFLSILPLPFLTTFSLLLLPLPPRFSPKACIMMMPMFMPPSSSMGSGVSVANPMAMCNPYMQQFMAHMASQSALMSYPYMAPMAFPPSSQVPSYPSPYPVHAPASVTTTPTPENVSSSAGGSFPLPAPTVAASVQQPPAAPLPLQSDQASVRDPNETSTTSTDLAHCA
jgi:hypothetical protein